jgi:hydroxymethylpyrimidine pyrophosphatase-like HAD family hydrolase
MKYRLIAIDVDGTLFDSTGRAPRENLEAIRRARQAGAVIVLCTGRGFKEAQDAIEALDHRGPIVLANGALITDTITGTTLHRASIEPHVSIEVIDCLLDGDDAVLVLLDPSQVEQDYLVVRPERLSGNTKWWFDHVGATYRGVEAVTEADLHHAVRVGIVGPASHMPPVQDRLVARFGQTLFVQHFMAVDKDDAEGEQVHVLEVFATGVSKWSALNWVAEELSIASHEIAAIGDHVNDVDMIANAGCGIAMANAVPPVIDAADRRTASNDQAGVARAIEKLLAGRW